MSESTKNVRCESPQRIPSASTIGNSINRNGSEDDTKSNSSSHTQSSADERKVRSRSRTPGSLKLVLTQTQTQDGQNPQRAEESQKAWHKAVRNTIPIPFAKVVIKCVIAYLVASLFTYIPPLAHRMALILPNHDPNDKVPISNLHFIATVAVYFHPGRSVGSMVEANVYALFGFVYAISLALISMVVAVHLHEKDFAVLSNIISVTIFVGIGTALIGYAKVRIARPTFNTACSLIGVIIFTTVVKEGSAHLGHFSTDKIWQVTLVVLVGVLTSNAICLLLWPQSACTSLQYDIQRNLRSFSTLLKVLTKTFLMDDVDEPASRIKRINAAIDNHHASFVSLKKDLEEAKLEAPFDIRIRGRVSSYLRVVDSLNVLAQHIGGLRTSCDLQRDIKAGNSTNPQSKSFKRRSVTMHLDGDGFDSMKTVQSPKTIDDQTESRQSPMYGDTSEQSAFRHYIDSLAPHVRQLVSTCSHALHGLTAAFEATLHAIDSSEGHKRDVQNGSSFDELGSAVRFALSRFRHERTVAIKRSYSVYPRESANAESLAVLKGLKSDEDVFLIFYFVFLLEEFAQELEKLIDAMETIRSYEKSIQEYRRFSRWWHVFNAIDIQPHSAPDRWGRRSRQESFMSTLASLFRTKAPGFAIPSPHAHQPNTSQTPLPLTHRDRLNHIVWSIGESLKQSDTKFAIKTGLGCATLASPAFISSWRPLFTLYQGQWALISFFVVLSPTVGQSNQLSVHRIGGTIIGALTATLAYWLFPDNNVALPIFGAIFALPCFWFIISKPQYASSGRFVLLTFNLTALYSYNVRRVGIEVEEIAARRTVDVIVGVVWATLLNHLIWPIEARRELAKGLSDMLFKLSFLYQKLVMAYSSVESDGRLSSREEGIHDSLESQPLLDGKRDGISEIQMIELALQVQLIRLEGYLVQTKHEPRLKGPFPINEYRRLIDCCQHTLDLLHIMNLVTSRPNWHTEVRQDFIVPVDATGKRRNMVGTVSLFFWLLASAFHLKTPLPPYMPPAEEARLAVLETIRQLPVVKRRAIRGSGEYLLYFAYAVSMKDLIHQLEEIARIAHGLFGTMSGNVLGWERQFQALPEELARMEAYLDVTTGSSEASQTSTDTQSV